MSNFAIRAENLGKRYRIGQRERYQTFQGALTQLAGAPLRLWRRLNQPIGESSSPTIWALRDVSFEIAPGEVVGIIGRNGAGKSTLLKLLARITAPTIGTAEIRGRIGSLLEVGTGFHPELTGRENVFLNGAILGMRNSEIRAKFDEIVAFADVEQFLDTPVKRYSSGMQMRLAFSVAAHLEPEILLIDEVLAVGDLAFQKKCLGKMGEVAQSGRTILLVSHNIGAVSRLCTQAIWLDKGQISAQGKPGPVIQGYMDFNTSAGGSVSLTPSKPARINFHRIWTTMSDQAVTSEVEFASGFDIHLLISVREPVDDLDIGMWVTNIREAPVFFTNLSDAQDGKLLSFQPGTYHLRFHIRERYLMPDIYKITIKAHKPYVRSEDYHKDVLSFQVIDTGSYLYRYPDAARHGCVVPEPDWSMTEADDIPKEAEPAHA